MRRRRTLEIKSEGWRPLGEFGHRFLWLRFREPLDRARTLGHLHGARRDRLALARLLFGLLATETDRREALQQRHARLLQRILEWFAALARAQLILRRHRQLVDPRHPGTALWPFRMRRDEVLGRRWRLRDRLLCGGFNEQGRLWRDWPNGEVITGTARQHGRRHGGGRLRLDRGRGRPRMRLRSGLRRRWRWCWCLRDDARLVAFVRARYLGADALRRLDDARFLRRSRPRRDHRRIDASRHHRDPDDAFEALVEGRADDDVGLLIDLLSDAGRRFIDLVEREVVAARD